jgi:hypothetical protein
MSSPRRLLALLLAAVLGIAVAAAVAWGTSQLVRQRIGLASEPLSAGQRLLPSSLTGAPAPPRTTTLRTRTVTTTVPAAAPPAPSQTQSSPRGEPPAVSAPARSQGRAPAPGGEGGPDSISKANDSAGRDD